MAGNRIGRLETARATNLAAWNAAETPGNGYRVLLTENDYARATAVFSAYLYVKEYGIP